MNSVFSSHMRYEGYTQKTKFLVLVCPVVRIVGGFSSTIYLGSASAQSTTRHVIAIFLQTVFEQPLIWVIVCANTADARLDPIMNTPIPTVIAAITISLLFLCINSYQAYYV